MSLTYKGVNYDTGTNYGAGGVLSREVWRPDLAGLEIQAIRDQLHCNAIGIFGTDVDRLAQAASVASEHGLYVWLQPRLVDADAGPSRRRGPRRRTPQTAVPGGQHQCRLRTDHILRRHHSGYQLPAARSPTVVASKLAAAAWV
jgi:hypothetical protein